jgi:ATP-dependent Clp protease ATP-binding subunit ClpB
MLSIDPSTYPFSTGYVGYNEGGQLTEYVRRKPYSIVLLDELEKAHKKFLMIFLQVLDDGRLTDGKGNVVDFRNTVIIMTSNIGASHLDDVVGRAIPSTARKLMMGAIEAELPPEFINRLDDVIIFVSILHVCKMFCTVIH